MRLGSLRFGWLCLLWAMVTLSGCAAPTSQFREVTNTPQATTVVPESKANPSPVSLTPTPEAPPQITPDPALPAYTIEAVYDASLKKVKVNQVIKFTHLSLKPIREILLVVEPNRFWNGFGLDRLENQITDEVLEWELQDNVLKIKLSEPLAYQQSIIIAAEYVLQLPEIPPPSDTRKPQIYGFTQRQTNLVDWYLWLPPYDEQTGWVIRSPSFFGEYTVYPLADFEIRFEVINSPREVIVAASSIPIEQSQNQWIYRHNKARNFVLSLSSDFQIAETELNGVKIHSYYFPLYQRQGEVVLQHTLQAYQLYSELFGELPRDSISAVQADFLDGMEFDGLFFLSKGFYDLYDGTDKGYLTLITVHETAHQWWYAAVANDQALYPWLDEALCTYAERLYYERLLPELLDWWWYFRINFYQPQGVIDLPVYEYKGYLAYRDAVYLRGALFLEELRRLLGDEQFFAGLYRFYTENFGRIVSPDDFFIAFNLSQKEVREKMPSFFSVQP